MEKGRRTPPPRTAVAVRAANPAAEPAGFLNIDLDVRSRRPIAGLLVAWPGADRPRRSDGRFHRGWLIIRAPGSVRTAEAAARFLLSEVERLPPVARRCWNHASRRTFDIGIQAGPQPPAFEAVQLEPSTLERIAAVGGRIQITVYAPVAGRRR